MKEEVHGQTGPLGQYGARGRSDGDVTANGLFAYSLSRRKVSMASGLGSLYPALTVYWARLLLG
jgi:hypothetical protein